MIRYELRKDTREMNSKERFEISQGCTQFQESAYPEIIETFDSKEEALKELEKYQTEIYSFQSNTGTCYEVTEYFVEEVEVNEDGERTDNGCNSIWFSEIKIELVAENSTSDSLGVFDNLQEAEKAMNDCEEKCHLRLYN